MKKIYRGIPTYYVSVDCIIFAYCEGKIQVLLQHRMIEPHIGELTLLGGFVEEEESLDDAAIRVLKERTGMTNVYLEQVETFGAIDRDPGGRVFSTAYFALLNKAKHDEIHIEKYNCKWVDIDNLPVLYFDHLKMLQKALTILQDKITYTPIALNLLPETFTLTQLQQVYEGLLGKQLDKRNFRKRVNDMPYFEKTDGVDKSMSKRGAAIYRFNTKKYKKMRGYHL